MYKFLSLLCCGFSLTAHAETVVEQCDLHIQKLPPNTLAFFYHPQAQTTPPNFYVKAMLESVTPETSVEQILKTGQNLIFVNNTRPHLYQVPEHTKKLFILTTDAKIENLDPAAQVDPVILEPAKQDERATRNASNYPQPLPDASLQPHLVQNVSSYPAPLKPSSKQKLKLCELVL